MWKAAKVKTPMSQAGNRTVASGRGEGFSLLELILVLVVMSLVAAITLPSMSRGRTAFHLRAVGRDVLSTLRFARETAVTQQKVMMVLVDSQAQQVTVSDDVGDGARSFKPPSDVRIQAMSTSGEALLQDPLMIRFLPNGSSDDARILLTSERGGTLRIVTDSNTGGARILADQGEKAP